MGGTDADDPNHLNKIRRVSTESLVLKLSQREIRYRNKFLPDPTELKDEKLLCSVCTRSIVQSVRGGADIYVHKFLEVLMCEACYNFYGDGCFSADEDGDDKYCRWCGQGGTLYICSHCTAGFCEQCLKINLKAPALATLERDDWECLLCYPRPIFGSRTICWAAQELNRIGKDEKKYKLKKQEEKLKQMARAKEKREEEKKTIEKLLFEDFSPKKRKRESQDSDSSTVEIPSKRSKHRNINVHSLNGITKRNRKKTETDSDDETTEDDFDSKSKNRHHQSSSSDGTSSDESACEKENSRKKHSSSDSELSHRKHKKKTKSTGKKHKTYSSDSYGSDFSEKERKKKLRKRKKRNSSDESLENNREKSKKKKVESSSDLSDDDFNTSTKSSKKLSKRKKRNSSDESLENNKKESKKKRVLSSSDDDNVNTSSKSKEVITDQSKKLSSKVVQNNHLNEANEAFKAIEHFSDTESITRITNDQGKKLVNGDLSKEEEKKVLSKKHEHEEASKHEIELTEKLELSETDKETHHLNEKHDHQSQSVPESESAHLSENLSVAEAKVEENIKLAMTFLNGIVDDISDLGDIIVDRTNKFANKKIFNNNLESYKDVLDTTNRLKRLISVVQENYTLIEKGLENQFLPWKIHVGLENPPPCEKPEEEEGIAEEKDTVSKAVSKDENIANLSSDKTVKESKLSVDINDSNEDPGDKTAHDSLEKLPNNKESSNKGEEIAEKDKGEVDLDKLTHNELENALPVTDKDLDEIKNTENSHESHINSATDLQPTGLSINSDSELNEHKTILLKDPSHSLEQDHPRSKSPLRSEGNLEQTYQKERIDKEELNVNKSNVTNELCPKNNEGVTMVSGVQSEEKKISEEKKNELEGSGVGKNDNLDRDSFGDKDENILGNEKDNSSVDVQDPSKEDAESFAALQELLCSSSEDEIKGSDSVSDDSSSDIDLDDSDLDIKQLRKVITKKLVKPKKKENNKLESEADTCAEVEEKGEIPKKETKQDEQEQIDSETEINMLTDMTKLKKKTSTKFISVKNSEEESEEESGDDDDDNDEGDNKGESRKRGNYKNESKKRREEERNELFGFLKDNKNSEDELDITKKDLDGIEGQYASSGSESMSLEAFSKKMNEKWKELDQQQDEMNLQLLLASSSEEGSDGGEDIVLNPEKKKKKVVDKKDKEENEEEVNAEENNVEEQAEVKEEKADSEVEVKEEKADVDDEENIGKESVKADLDEEYEQFLEDMTKQRTKFQGLGSSSEQSGKEDEIEIKEEVLSDDLKIKEEPKNSDKDSSDSDSSDLFVDISKKKSMKKKSWRNHRLLRVKLSDTDTSDEERWWRRRMEKEEKKKKEKGDSDSSGYNAFAQGLARHKKSVSPKQSADSGSDKENKKQTKGEEVEEISGSSTLELSSTDSSGSSVFKKKKKKKKASDSDITIISDDDSKKKKKKKKRRGADDSSDESSDSDDDVIELSQKSTLGESPGKGGRKNIRKVLTKNELAAATKAAAKEEEERKKRIAARQKLFNEMFEIKAAETLQKLVLDFDPDTKTELISVDQDLVTKMKPHQAKGVKFMWDSCFESLSQLKTKKGSGCILAHCMGLGKTFQVISLVHTILKHKDTQVKTVLVVCPLSTVLNWVGEFRKWLDDVAGGRDIRTYHLTKLRRPHERLRELMTWNERGGVMIMGYEMFRNLSNESTKKFRMTHKQGFQRTLIDPGADLVVCDEGHMLKNESTVLSKAMSRIKSLRRIVLTGTPMQNNLKEYHCMVQFVKPNLLGTRKEFLNQFVNPITNGQFVDSTESDVKVMKRRAHVLHKMLEGLVQRFDYSVLTPFLPPKYEYVVSLRLSDVQVKLYQFYLDHFSQGSNSTRTGSQLFADYQALGRIWTHPLVVKMSTDKAEKERKKRLEESEESEEEDEGSMKDFIDDKSSVSLSSSHSSSSSLSSDDDTEEKKNKTEKKDEKKNEIELGANKITPTSDDIETAINLISSDEEEPVKKMEINENKDNPTETAKEMKNEDEKCKNGLEQAENKGEETPEEIEKKSEGDKGEREKGDVEEKKDKDGKEDKQNKKESKKEELDSKSSWWKPLVEPKQLEDINQSAKLVLLFAILHECELIEDKVLVFSQSLFSLDLIELFLEKIDRATEENRLDESLGNHAGYWTKGLDYFRLDGSSSSENRSAWCKSFNKEDNTRARLFLISTKAGGLGINLTAANRVIIFDASWNPSHDVQSIFRIYRFGQRKPCYVYRFIANGTMEEKVYDRQVAKQSLSSRVIDEQQVHRHFSMNDLNELYTFTPPGPKVEKPTPVLPKDRLMAELLTQYSDWIEKYHEHDSLLENVVEEELNEEERKLAWEDFENDKKKAFTPGVSGGVNFGTNPAAGTQVEFFRKSLKLKYPTASDVELNAMLQTLIYQINMRNKLAPHFISKQPQAQPGASTSQAGPSNTNLTPQQKFSLQKNHLVKKFGQQTRPGEMIGNGVIKKQNHALAVNVQTAAGALMRNQNQTVGNMPASAQAGTYEELMRQQQQANLERVRNQRVIQQAMMNNFSNSASTMLNNVYQPGANRTLKPAQNRQQPIPNLQKTVLDRQNAIQNRIQNQRAVQNPGVTDNVSRNWNSAQQLQQSPQTSFLNNRQSNKVLPRSQKTQQQLMQEQMRKRISDLQQQKQLSLQRTMRQPQSTPLESQKKKLEEMKNRYKASRNQLSNKNDIPVVDIDDDRPSDSAT